MKNADFPFASDPVAPLSVIALLLAGLWALLGRPFVSAAERRAYRERAYRVRRAMTDVERGFDIKAQNKDVLDIWSGDASSSWRNSMCELWLWAQGVFWRFVLRLTSVPLLQGIALNFGPCLVVRPP